MCVSNLMRKKVTGLHLAAQIQLLIFTADDSLGHTQHLDGQGGISLTQLKPEYLIKKQLKTCPEKRILISLSLQVVMMVGLPGSGKSFWARTLMKQHPEKNYRLLGTEDLLACMLVSKKTSFGFQLLLFF